MNERYAALAGVLAGEVGSSVCLALGVPESPIFRTVQGPMQLLGPQGICVLALAVLLGVGMWVVNPKVWRLRQQVRSKVRILSWFGSGVSLLAGAVTLYFFEVGGPWSPPASELEHSGEALASAVAIQLVTWLFFYGAAIWVAVLISSNRVVQVTPNPKFGRS